MKHLLITTLLLISTSILTSCGSGLESEVKPETTPPPASSGGDTGSGGGTTPTGCNPCRIYSTVTALPSGRIGATAAAAVTAADNYCMIDANKPATGTFKAMLYAAGVRVACTTANCSVGGASEHIDWVFAPNKTYYQLDGTTVIGTTDAAGLLPSTLTNPAEATTINEFWAGLETDYTPGASNCSNWTSNSGADRGVGGASTYQDVRFVNIGDNPCDVTYQGLLCVEQ